MALGSLQVTVLAPPASIEAMWSRPLPQVPIINQLIKYHDLGQLTGNCLGAVHIKKKIENMRFRPPPHVPIGINPLTKC